MYILYLIYYKINFRKFIRTKGDRKYLHSADILDSLKSLSKYLRIDEVQFNNFLFNKPIIKIYKKNPLNNKGSFIIKLSGSSNYIISFHNSNKPIKKNTHYDEKINLYQILNNRIDFKIMMNMTIFENIISANKIFCYHLSNSKNKFIAVRFLFYDYKKIFEEVESIYIEKFKIISDTWFENIVYINDKKFCKVLFKKE